MTDNKIYFRVWDNATGSFSRISPFSYIPKNDRHPDYFMVAAPQKGLTVEMSVGVLDILGKPIFPGDFVRILWRGGYTGTAQVHRRKCGAVVLRAINTDTAFVSYLIDREDYSYEVIGNIHEHPSIEYRNRGAGENACE